MKIFLSRKSISGLVAEYIVAIDVTRVRFSADAYARSFPFCSRESCALPLHGLSAACVPGVWRPAGWWLRATARAHDASYSALGAALLARRRPVKQPRLPTLPGTLMGSACSLHARREWSLCLTNPLGEGTPERALAKQQP